MAHKGVREWTSDEISSVALGQNGFHILTGTSAITAASKGITYWIALKAVDGASEVEASSYGDGDDLSKTGTYGSGNWIDLADGDIVYGAFDEVDMNAATDFIIAYIGK